MYPRTAQLNTFHISLALSVVLVTLLFTYLFIAVNIMREGYVIEELVNTISVVEKDNAQLRIELSQVHSLDNILAASSGLFYSEIKQVNYLRKARSAPFAAR